jgi:hypothetical protein
VQALRFFDTFELGVPPDPEQVTAQERYVLPQHPRFATSNIRINFLLAPRQLVALLVLAKHIHLLNIKHAVGRRFAQNAQLQFTLSQIFGRHRSAAGTSKLSSTGAPQQPAGSHRSQPVPYNLELGSSDRLWQTVARCAWHWQARVVDKRMPVQAVSKAAGAWRGRVLRSALQASPGVTGTALHQPNANAAMPHRPSFSHHGREEASTGVRISSVACPHSGSSVARTSFAMTEEAERRSSEAGSIRSVSNKGGMTGRHEVSWHWEKFDAGEAAGGADLRESASGAVRHRRAPLRAGGPVMEAADVMSTTSQEAEGAGGLDQARGRVAAEGLQRPETQLHGQDVTSLSVARPRLLSAHRRTGEDALGAGPFTRLRHQIQDFLNEQGSLLESSSQSSAAEEAEVSATVAPAAAEEPALPLLESTSSRRACTCSDAVASRAT